MRSLRCKIEHSARSAPLYSKKLEGSVCGEVRDSVPDDRHPADRFQCLLELFTPQL
jgi:hypothetical protein